MEKLGVKNTPLTGITDLQKASLWKRISAALFDFIILGIVVIGIMTLLSGALGYEKHLDTFKTKCEEYSQLYGVEPLLSEETVGKMTEAEQKNYDAANKALNADPVAVRAYRMYTHLPLLMVTGGVLSGILILQVIVPALFGNGQSLGKKIFGVALMRVDGVKLSGFQLFVRSVLGKFTIELMIPIYVIWLISMNSVQLFGLAMLLLLLVAQILCLVITRTGSFLHDVLAGTVAVDMASQMIFATEEEKLRFIKEQHAKKVERSTY